MALMFQRLARSFAKNGYYPTDEETTKGILSRLSFCIDENNDKQGVVRILDPCCGEGVILAEAKAYLGECFTSLAKPVVSIEAVGVEIDEERAYHAKSMSNLDTVVHSNLNDCYIGQRQFGLLLLNPPYGYVLDDKANLTENSGKERYETMFYENTNKLLQFGGVLVFIVPNYCLNEKLSKMIASHFDQVTVYAAPEQKFKQVVIFGIRCKAKVAKKNVVDKLLKASEDITTLETLNDQVDFNADGCFYPVPTSSAELKLNQTKIDAKQLASEVNGNHRNSLWERFQTHFNNAHGNTYRPLRAMSDWHLSLALAAGQISGVVKSKDGRALLVKGRTFKDKKETTKTEVNEKTGNVRETRISTDVFVPIIKAIDFTKNSDTFGEVVTIK